MKWFRSKPKTELLALRATAAYLDQENERLRATVTEAVARYDYQSRISQYVRSLCPIELASSAVINGALNPGQSARMVQFRNALNINEDDLKGLFSGVIDENAFSPLLAKEPSTPISTGKK